MTRRKLLRRALILSCHCLRNIGFYRAGWHKGSLVFRDDFWRTVNGNFMDICVLEWCKLFGDTHGKHFWQKIISDPAVFYSGLLRELGKTEDELNAYVDEVRDYRDKFVAHLDSEEIMHPPVLDVAKGCVSYLYDYLLAHEDEGNYFPDLRERSSKMFYASVLKQGESVYRGEMQHYDRVHRIIDKSGFR